MRRRQSSRQQEPVVETKNLIRGRNFRLRGAQTGRRFFSLARHAFNLDHYENFPVASVLVPRHLRAPIQVIYRFARGADDIADEGQISDAARLASLASYRAQLRRVAGGLPPDPDPEPELFATLGHAIREWELPLQLFEDLLDAFCQDVGQKRYADFAALADYCRRSANPVGRLLLALYKVCDEVSLKRSDSICTSLQLINFWQDVALDLEKGRVYMPQETLRQHGFGPGEDVPGAWDGRFRAAMKFELDRARALMLHGAPLARTLQGRVGWELALVVQGGLRIIEKTEAVQYDVFKRRPVLGKPDWLVMAVRAATARLCRPVQ